MSPVYAMVGGLFVMMLAFTLPTLWDDHSARRARHDAGHRGARRSEVAERPRGNGLRGVPRVRQAGRGA